MQIRPSFTPPYKEKGFSAAGECDRIGGKGSDTMIQNFEDFCRELNTCGFSMGGGNAKGIFALIDYDWTNQDSLDTPVKWHCGNPEVDPWEWRMRVLEERADIAYSKVLFKTSGFITKDWYTKGIILCQKRERSIVQNSNYWRCKTTLQEEVAREKYAGNMESRIIRCCGNGFHAIMVIKTLRSAPAPKERSI